MGERYSYRSTFSQTAPFSPLATLLLDSKGRGNTTPGPAGGTWDQIYQHPLLFPEYQMRGVRRRQKMIQVWKLRWNIICWSGSQGLGKHLLERNTFKNENWEPHTEICPSAFPYLGCCRVAETIGTSGWRSVPRNRRDANSKIKCNMLEMAHTCYKGWHPLYVFPSTPLDAQHVICASPLKFCYYTLETSMTSIQGWPVSMNKFSGTPELSLWRQRNVYSPSPIPRAPAPSKHALLKPDPDGELSMSIPRKEWLKPTVILSNSLLKRASHREGNFNTTGLSWSRFYIIKSRIKREPKSLSKHSQQHYPHLLPGLNCSWDMVECLTPGVTVCGLHYHF